MCMEEQAALEEFRAFLLQAVPAHERHLCHPKKHSHRPGAPATAEAVTLGMLFALGNTVGWGNALSAGQQLLGWAWGVGGGAAAPASNTTWKGAVVSHLASSLWSAVRPGVVPKQDVARVDKTIEGLAAVGAATDLPALAAQARASGRMVVPLFLIVLTAALEYSGRRAKNAYKQKRAAQVLPDEQDSLVSFWADRHALDPVGWILNVLAGLVVQLAYYTGAGESENPMGTVGNTVDTLLSWEVLARLLQVYNLAPLQLASGTLAIFFSSPPTPPPPPSSFRPNIWRRLAGGSQAALVRR